MTTQIETSREGRLGVIALARPEAINALSVGMIAGITDALAAWRDDPAIRAVLFESRAPRGFCAGGDVRYLREEVLAGRPQAADAYFAAEYAMNGLIANYPKPVVSIAGGIVMGGGIGIASHAAFRVTTPEALFAMPEGAIGFFADVGVNWILAQSPEPRALLFLLSGLEVSGADALALGLADCCVLPDALEEVRAGIVAAAATGDVEPALVAFLQSRSIQPGERWLCTLADRLSDALSLESAGEIVEEITDIARNDASLGKLAAVLAGRSPTSLEAMLQSHRAARGLTRIEEVLAMDARLAAHLVRLPDFAEGVRAQLVDKDRRPRWNPADHAGVDREAIAALVGEARLQLNEKAVSTS